MKRIISILLLSHSLITFSAIGKTQAVSHVNPFIGTGAVKSSLSGNNFPGATLPFGMVQLSPDTRNAPDWAQASGYDYNDTSIFGFSHTHLSGTGVAELCDVLVMPFTGDINKQINIIKNNQGLSSSFSHNEEKASPGYYRVKLQSFGVDAELTATTRTGVQRYTFPTDSESHVLVDLNHSMNKNSWLNGLI